MKISFLSLSLAILMGFSSAAGAQTSCGIQHSGPGVFICYPTGSGGPSGAAVPELFHVSAQANAPEGAATRHYSVFLDNQLLYDNRLATPIQRLSIEVNVRSPFHSGAHTLRVAVAEIGTAEVKNLQLHPWANAGFCEPLAIVQSVGACFSSLKAPLNWSAEPRMPTSLKDPIAGYLSYLEPYRRNLKSLEADVADAVALDSQGNLYVALHLIAGLELRKYTPNRSIVYDSVVQTCGGGFLAISGLAVDTAGHAWMAGNTTACLSGTTGAWKPRVGNTSDPHGFVLLLDTSKATSTAPIYVTYLADVDNEISGIRVDAEGNAYVTGRTSSVEFPHKAVLPANSAAPGKGGRMSFVSVLDRSGSSLRWSTLLQDVDFPALALDGTNSVYLAGETGGHSDALLVQLASDGGKLSNVTRLGPGAARAISVSAHGAWVVVERESQSLALVPEPCTKGKITADLLPRDDDSAGAEISTRLALDAFASQFSACRP